MNINEDKLAIPYDNKKTNYFHMKMIKLMVGLFIASLLIFKCTSQKKVGYDFPDQMLPHVKVEFTKQCDKGQQLYTLSCAKCHDKKFNGKKVIPDFKPEQLSGYELRVANAKHTVALEDTLITTEELALIMTFLSYKKKSGLLLTTKK